MTPSNPAKLSLVLSAFVIVTAAAACSSDEGPEGSIPDGPLVAAISMEYPASDPTAASAAETVCKNHGQTAKLDKTEQKGGISVNFYKCQ